MSGIGNPTSQLGGKGAGVPFTPPIHSMAAIPSITGMQVINIPPQSLASGNNAVYTIPAGMRALILGIAYNPSLTATALFPEVNLSGTLFQLNATSSPASLGNASLNFNGFIGEAGDIFNINQTLAQLTASAWGVVGAVSTLTGTFAAGAAKAYNGKSIKVSGFSNAGNNGTFVCTGSTTTTMTFATTTQVIESHASIAVEQTFCTAFLVVYQFPNTNPWKTSRITSFVNGDNQIYTPTSGKTGYIGTPIGIGIFTAGSAVGGTELGNFSGGTISYTWNLIPNGGSASISNIIAKSTAIVNNAFTSLGVGAFSVASGGSLSVNSSSTGKQIAWITVFEQ